MREDDVEAVHELVTDVDVRGPRAPATASRSHPRPDPAMAHVRYRHLVRTDPGRRVGGRGRAGDRGLRARDPARGRLGPVAADRAPRPAVERARPRAAATRRTSTPTARAGRIILSSPDPRALRAYARLGLDAAPVRSTATACRATSQRPTASARAPRDDIPFTEEVDRHVRGAAHGADIGAQLEMGQTLLIAPERGYAVTGDGELRLLAAFDDDGAQRPPARGARPRRRARADRLLDHLPPAVGDRGLRRGGPGAERGRGAVFLGGDVGPFTPYLPSGAFL